LDAGGRKDADDDADDDGDDADGFKVTMATVPKCCRQKAYCMALSK
jgi:hypothetical protein